MIKKAAFALVMMVVVCALVAPVAVQAQDGDDGVIVYIGEGWTLDYPANATFEALSANEFRINGPVVQFRFFDYDAMFEGPAYTMNITVEENPEQLPVETFVTQKILAEWQTVNAEGGPNTLPVLDDGSAFEPDKIHTVTINGLAAFKVEFFGGDSAMWRVYVASGDMVITFMYNEYPLGNNPLALFQVDMYSLIMNTLEFGVG